MKKNEGLSEQVYNYLLSQILSDELKPGEKIAEAKIAQEFNTSRTPIREAMQKIRKSGTHSNISKALCPGSYIFRKRNSRYRNDSYIVRYFVN